ncbi:unnamed protein product [Amoebophrya sp. A120]|nr:unnamed protein product [Amoebophrya sp. A120]|eukprot:GSA120T00010209001.1
MVNPLRLLVLLHRQTCDSTIVPDRSDLYLEHHYRDPFFLVREDSAPVRVEHRVLSLAVAIEHHLLSKDYAIVFGTKNKKLEKFRLLLTGNVEELQLNDGAAEEYDRLQNPLYFVAVEHLSEIYKAELEDKTQTCWRKQQLIARSHMHAARIVDKHFAGDEWWKFRLFNCAVFATVCFIFFVLYPSFHRAAPRAAKKFACMVAGLYLVHEMVIREQIFGAWPSFALYGSERGWVVTEVYDRWRDPVHYLQNNVFFNPFVGELVEAYRKVHDVAYTAMWGFPPPTSRSDKSLPVCLLRPRPSSSCGPSRHHLPLVDLILGICILPLTLHHIPTSRFGKTFLCTAAGRLAFDDLSVVLFLLYPNASVEMYASYWSSLYSITWIFFPDAEAEQTAFDLRIAIFPLSIWIAVCLGLAKDFQQYGFFIVGRLVTAYDVGLLLLVDLNVVSEDWLSQSFLCPRTLWKRRLQQRRILENMPIEAGLDEDGDGEDDEAVFAWEMEVMLEEIPTPARNSLLHDAA